MPSSSTSGATNARPPGQGPDIGLALQPFHLAQLICEADPERGMTVVARDAARWAPLLACRPDLTFVPVEDRAAVLAGAKARRDPFTVVHAVPWNRTAVRLERAALRAGGRVTLIEDGVGCYRKPQVLTLKQRLRQLAYRVLDGTRYAEHVAGRTGERNVRLVSLVPDRAAARPRPEPLDVQPFRALLPQLAEPFADFARWRGHPVFFDTNDVDSGWLSLTEKVALLRELLPPGPMVYFRHPFQTTSLVGHVDGLVDLTDAARGWNEMATFVIAPERIVSAFSSAAITLRHLFGLPVTHTTLHGAFLARTGAPGYAIGPDMAALIA